jgi:hypothetical protein
VADRLKPIGDGLGALFSELQKRAESTQLLAEKVRSALPGKEKDHVLSASYREDALIVVVDAAVWCARIRYAHEALRKALEAAGEKPFTKLKVRVGRRIADSG